MPLSRKQVDRLLTPVRPDRIERVRGNSYVPQYEARAELTRVFGPGNWDSEIHSVTLIYEEPEDRSAEGADKPLLYWRVCYRAACTLIIRDYHGEVICTHTEYHAEECAPQPNRGEAHALALTSVESYAFRRACVNLGDSFGLHLYRDGQLAPLVKGTLLITDPESPMYDASNVVAAVNPPLTDEQKASLQSSLGATVINENEAAPV